LWAHVGLALRLLHNRFAGLGPQAFDAFEDLGARVMGLAAFGAGQRRRGGSLSFFRVEREEQRFVFPVSLASQNRLKFAQRPNLFRSSSCFI
jgi:hypothetical protein